MAATPVSAEARPGRLSAEERRQAIIQAALIEFSDGGYFGTATESIAARAGISQPYIFRLFGSKKKLFIATAEMAFRRILETFQAVAAGAGSDPFPAMGSAYLGLLSDRRLLMLWMHAFAACSDPEIQSRMAAGFSEMFEFLEGLPGATPEKVFEFMSYGMFLNVAASTNMRSAMTPDQWARRCLP